MLWTASYWLGIAGVAVLLFSLGVHPVVPIFLAIFSVPVFIMLASRR